MSALLDPDHAVRLHRAEQRWLDQCADRLRRARAVRPAPADSTPTEGTTR